MWCECGVYFVWSVYILASPLLFGYPFHFIATRVARIETICVIADFVSILIRHLKCLVFTIICRSRAAAGSLARDKG